MKKIPELGKGLDHAKNVLASKLRYIHVVALVELDKPV